MEYSLRVVEMKDKEYEFDGVCPVCKKVELEEIDMNPNLLGDTVWTMECPECKKKFEVFSRHYAVEAEE